MIYKINIKKKAQKFINRQDTTQQLRIYKAISKLPQGNIQLLKGYETIYRLRLGNYRIIFEWNKNVIIINVIDIDNRGDIYKRY